MAKPLQWGMTPPLSRTHPTPVELAQNEALLAELKAKNCFEKQEESDHRVVILNHLQKVVEKFVLEVGLHKKSQLDEKTIQSGGGKVFTFGSYRLGVYGPDSDIDTLVVTPNHVTRSDFFEMFPSILEKMSPKDAINSLTPVPGAYVPIIKMVYEGVDIDLTFVSLRVSSVPREFDLRDPNVVKELDESELRSLNGPPVADEIISLVPQKNTFRFALRAVKLWADVRGVYGAVNGFPGGIAWALMVARICQLYPYACGSTIVTKFFHLMSEWPWHRPVHLKEIESDPNRPYIRVWNPKLSRLDAFHIMPVITPTFPSMCSTHTVSYTTFEIIQRELVRAKEVTGLIANGEGKWSDLFEKYPFFTSGYKYYLSVIATAKSKSAAESWSGLVKSRLRFLVNGIQQSDAGVRLAHPYTSGFHRRHLVPESKFKDVCQGDLSYVVVDSKKGGAAPADGALGAPAPAENKDGPAETKPEASAPAEAADAKKEECIEVYTTTLYVGLELKKGYKTLDISFPVTEFIGYCVGMDSYNAEEHFLRVVHTRNYDLPDDVFSPSEAKPTRARKSKAVGSTDGSSRKRSFASAAMDESANAVGKRHRNVQKTAAAPS